jgi:hypothetical protein
LRFTCGTFQKSEVFTAVTMKNIIIWDVTWCNPVEFQWHFWGMYCSVCRLLLADQLQSLLFDLKDEGSMFFWHVSQLLLDYVASHTKRQYSLWWKFASKLCQNYLSLLHEATTDEQVRGAEERMFSTKHWSNDQGNT